MKINLGRVMELCEEDDYVGICTSCGYEQDCVEPDGREYKCEECGENKVFGSQELMIMLY